MGEIAQKLDALKRAGLYRTRKVTHSPCAPSVVVNARRMLAFNSNDYLGLAADPRVVDAFKEGASRYGAGSGASHMISGHSLAHAQLEEQLAGFLSSHIESARALYFCTGYMANLAVVTSLVEANKEHAEIFSEAVNHASIIDAVRLSRAKCTVYPHCDFERLGELLRASNAKNKIVITDGVFSMDGDIAPVKELLRVCTETNAWLIIDDAHGFGVLGKGGRGSLEHFGLEQSNVIYMGTLGKAAGVGGAFICANEKLIDWIIQKARSYIYTTAAPPAAAHALLTSLEIIGSAEGALKRAHLTQLAEQFKNGMRLIKSQWNLLASETPIQPVVIGSNEDVMHSSSALDGLNLWVTAIRAPTVPVGSARLRITLSAAHTVQDVDQLLGGLGQIADIKALGVKT
jgi:8-amino-7-oxononanoate synthase